MAKTTQHLNDGRLLPPEHPQAPKYWRCETSGKLAAAIERYLLQQEPVTVEDIAYIRAYLRQWINSPVWDSNPYGDGDCERGLRQLRAGVDNLTSSAAIGRWLWDAMEFGIDPL